MIALDEATPEPLSSNDGMRDFSKRVWHGHEEGGNRWWYVSCIGKLHTLCSY